MLKCQGCFYSKGRKEYTHCKLFKNNTFDSCSYYSKEKIKLIKQNTSSLKKRLT